MEQLERTVIGGTIFFLVIFFLLIYGSKYDETLEEVKQTAMAAVFIGFMCSMGISLIFHLDIIQRIADAPK
jgi:uncharacterized membrane protein